MIIYKTGISTSKKHFKGEPSKHGQISHPSYLKKLREKASISAQTWEEHSKSKRRVKPKVAHTQIRDPNQVE